MVSAINQNGEIFATKVKENSVNADSFLDFLRCLRSCHDAGETMYVYLDNLKVHHTQMVKQYCSENNVTLVFAPAYSSEYNPIERLWALSKAIFTKRIACLDSVT